MEKIEVKSVEINLREVCLPVGEQVGKDEEEGADDEASSRSNQGHENKTWNIVNKKNFIMKGIFIIKPRDWEEDLQHDVSENIV